MTEPTYSLLSIDHVQLAMPPGEEDAARRFYGDLLGLRETPKPPAMAARGGCWFEAGAIRLHLGVEPDFRPARKAHPAIGVRELDQLARRLDAQGVEVRPDAELEGVARFFVNDPFGNRLEFLEPLNGASPVAWRGIQPDTDRT